MSGGVTENVEFAILTNEIYKEWSGHTAKVTRDYLEEQLGKSIITNENKLDYQYVEEKQIK